MANSKHLWQTRWRMNTDSAGILAGVKNLEFSLRYIPEAGGRRYRFIYTPEDPANDPFKDTEFTENGGHAPVSPVRKLRRYRESEEGNYRRVIREQIGSPSLNMLRLTGTKTVDGILEWLTMFVIPDATEWHENHYRHLIFVTCEVSDGAAPGSFRRRVSSLDILQDGTAHGNPK